MRRMRFVLGPCVAVVIAACSNQAPRSSAVVLPAHNEPSMPSGKTIAYFEGQVDIARGRFDVSVRTPSGLQPDAILPYGTSPGSVFFHTCGLTFTPGSPNTLLGSVTAINQMSGTVTNMNAWVDSISETGATMGTGSGSVPPGIVAAYGTVAQSTTNCTAPMQWQFNLPTANSFSFTGHAEGNPPSGGGCTHGSTTLSFVTSTIQTFTVPSGCTAVNISAAGGAGDTGPAAAGLGATMVGDFTLTPGQVLSVLVGGTVSPPSGTGNGGGGTFVVDQSSGNPLIIAGGGGGGSASGAGIGAVTTANGTASDATGCTAAGAGGTGGGSDGGQASNPVDSGAGGGFTNNGADGNGGPLGGVSFKNGGGGSGNIFGGGGGGGNGGAGGGGGGYAGGGGGCGAASGGGGGGSFNSGASQVNTAANHSGAGQVVFTY